MPDVGNIPHGYVELIAYFLVRDTGLSKRLDAIRRFRRQLFPVVRVRPAVEHSSIDCVL